MNASVMLIGLLAILPSVAFAQSGNPPPAAPAANRVMLKLVASIEAQITGVAEEMPAGKYEFAPTDGNFRGVRNFARQLKHAAAVHHLVAATILGERVTADMSDERGPDSIKSKAEVLQYLKDSFSALKRAAETVNESNAFAPFKGPFGDDTRVGLIGLAVTHSSNHYGQVVEYLRMNGLTPPRTQ
jgi:uncharacterized damage-inducible protein DinB